LFLCKSNKFTYLQGYDKASLLTASGVLLNAFPLMFTSLLHVTSSISGKLCLQTANYYFIEHLQRNVLTANFLP
jgi:hypothetical protein